jgi:DNA-binding transcriptional MerR regulator
MAVKDMLSIKEFSELTGVKQTTLRYYDDMGLFSPAVRTESGYRYYSPIQIITLNMIRVMQDLQVPMKEITAAERDRTPESVLKLLIEQESILDAKLRQINRSYNVIRTFKNLIFFGMEADVDEIGVRYFEAMPGIFGPVNDFGESEYFYDAFVEFCGNSKSLRVDLNYPIAGYFDTVAEFFKQPGRPKRFFSVDPSGMEEQPAGEYLYGYTRGYYGDLGDLPERMTAYAAEHGIPLGGPVFHLYLHDEVSVKDHDNYLSRVIVAVDSE